MVVPSYITKISKEEFELLENDVSEEKINIDKIVKKKIFGNVHFLER
jgi:hypothetical protein